MPNTFTDGQIIGRGPGWCLWHLATITPAATNQTSTAWVDISNYGWNGVVQVVGAPSTTCGPEIHGLLALAAAPLSTPAIGTAGILWGSTLTTATFYDMDNLPPFIRVYANANTTTAGSIGVYYMGRSPFMTPQ